MRVVISLGNHDSHEDKERSRQIGFYDLLTSMPEYFVGMVARRYMGAMAFISDTEALDQYGACVADIALAGRTGIELAKDFFRHWMGVTDAEQNVEHVALLRKSDFRNYDGLVWWDLGETIGDGVEICLSDNFFTESKWPGVDPT